MDRQLVPTNIFVPLRTVGTITDPLLQAKLTNRGRTARVSYKICNKSIWVLMLDTHQTTTVRQSDFAPQHPNIDPDTTLESALQWKYTAPPPPHSMMDRTTQITYRGTPLPRCGKIVNCARRGNCVIKFTGLNNMVTYAIHTGTNKPIRMTMN